MRRTRNAKIVEDPYHRLAVDAAHPEPEPNLSDAICCAMRRAAGLLGIAAAVTYTSSGHTSLRAARERPAAPILSMGADPATARRMALVWGVHSVLTGHLSGIEEVTSYACRAVREEGFAGPGDIIAITAGTPFGVPGNTNLLKLAAV